MHFFENDNKKKVPLWMLPKRGADNGERATGNREWESEIEWSVVSY